MAIDLYNWIHRNSSSLREITRPNGRNQLIVNFDGSVDDIDASVAEIEQYQPTAVITVRSEQFKMTVTTKSENFNMETLDELPGVLAVIVSPDRKSAELDMYIDFEYGQSRMTINADIASHIGTSCEMLEHE